MFPLFCLPSAFCYHRNLNVCHVISFVWYSQGIPDVSFRFSRYIHEEELSD